MTISGLDTGGIRGSLQAGFRLADVTWFRVGGPAELLFQPADEADLALFMSRLPKVVPVTIIGLGSNLLVRDGGIEGVVIRLGARGFGGVEPAGEDRLRAGCAVPDKALAKAALDAGLGGFAFYHGIPGGIGGALRMNAGANGGETRQRVVEVRAVSRVGEIVTLTNADMGYAYRIWFLPPPCSLVCRRRAKRSKRRWLRCKRIARPRSRSVSAPGGQRSRTRPATAPGSSSIRRVAGD